MRRSQKMKKRAAVAVILSCFVSGLFAVGTVADEIAFLSPIVGSNPAFTMSVAWCDRGDSCGSFQRHSACSSRGMDRGHGPRQGFRFRSRQLESALCPLFVLRRAPPQSYTETKGNH